MRISDWSSDVCSSDLVRRHRAGRDRRLLPAVPLVAQGWQRLAAAAGRGRAGGIRLAADPACDRIGARVCRVWRRLRDSGDRLAGGGGGGAADALGHARRAVVTLRDGGQHVVAPPPGSGGLRWPSAVARGGCGWAVTRLRPCAVGVYGW